MRRSPVLVNSIITAILVCAAALVLYRMHSFPVFEEVPWIVHGQLFDKSSNRLADVHVKVFNVYGTTTSRGPSPPKGVGIETNTDAQGRFVIGFRAAAYQIAFHKPGYVDEVQSFECIGTHCDRTNQNLQVFLEPEQKAIRASRLRRSDD